MDNARAVLPAQEGGPEDVPGAAPERSGRGRFRRGRRGGSDGGDARGALWRGGRWDPYTLSAVLFCVYAAVSLTRYRRMDSMSWDLGIFEQAVKSYAHLHAPVADLKGPGFNILGDHFSPITALLAPFYRLFPTPVTLLTAQALLFALSVIPVTRVAARLLGRGRGAAVGMAYGLSWGVQRALDFDFHEIAFAMPLLAFSLEAVLRRRWAAAMWWALPLVLVKEDMGASVAMIGVVVLLRTRRGRGADDREGGSEDGAARAYAPALVAFGVAASAWEIRWFIPYFHGPGYDALNHLDGDGALTGHIPAATAVRTLLWILLPAGGLLALRSPLLLVTLPTLGWRCLSHYPENWGTGWHYSAVLMPVVFLALVDAIAALGAVEQDGSSGAVGGGAPGGPRPWQRAGRRARGLTAAVAAGAPAATAGAALALCAQLPVAGLTHRATYTADARTRAVERMLDRIPDGATVESDVGPLGPLVRRTTVYWIGGTQGLAPQYIALADASAWLPDAAGTAGRLHPGVRYAVLAEAGGGVVLRRE
ncbi:DUF2079 domain-containing protein [Streptomyces sp. V4-01]|uniref:DUF2079 domain-containing protein n=1 Tax=Actinacidiphila polyblastidii TaxID=3110430 RepID=A0ABU7PES3_9ACTN|nr:DUF2079 domain-containing protein [Streptomyces sp. V4-01]